MSPMTSDSFSTDHATLRLSHGAVRFVLQSMNFGHEDGEAAFDATLKALRRAGVPFGTAAPAGGGGKDVVYGDEDLAELVVALGLLEQGLRLRHVGMLFRAARSELRPLLREVIDGAGSGAGEQAEITVCTQGRNGPVPADDRPMRIKAAGVWLAWPTVCRSSGIMEYRPPRLVGPGDAVDLFMRGQSTLRFRPPLPISDLLQTALALAREAPRIRRGRRPGIPQGRRAKTEPHDGQASSPKETRPGADPS